MAQRQQCGMQHEPGCRLTKIIGCVEIISENGVANAQQMKSQLMRSSRDRMQFQSRPVFLSFDDFPVRDGRAAVHVIDQLPRRIVHVLPDGRIDGPLINGDQTSYDGFIVLFDFTVLELPAEFPMGIRISGHHDQT